MRLLVDENLPVRIAFEASSVGIESAWVGEVLHGEPDEVILDRLLVSGETLVTRDKKFANMIVDAILAGASLKGVVLLREQSLSVMLEVWRAFLSDPVEVEGIVVLNKHGRRYRRLI